MMLDPKFVNGRKWFLFFLILFIFGIFQLGFGHRGVNAQTEPGNEHELSLEELPLEFHRRASQLLEEMRGGPIAPNWTDAQLVDPVRLLYRPDVEAVAEPTATPFEQAAYLEFKLVGADGSDRGFIILSTGDHDFPVVHWDDAGQTPTEWVAEEALANRKIAVKFYKIDLFSYAGETAEGELAAMPGNDPIKIIGLTSALAENASAHNGSASWESNLPDDADDANSSDFSSVASTSGSQDGPIEFAQWDSWQALKDGFETSYGPMADDLAELAAEEWEFERNVAQFGQGLVRGNSYTFSLLQNSAPAISLTGEGSSNQYVSVEVIEQAAGPALLQISVLDADPILELPLEIAIEYAAPTLASNLERSNQPSSAETLRFFLMYQEIDEVFGEDTQTLFLPMVAAPVVQTVQADQATSADRVAQGPSLQPRAATGSWSNWNWHSAGNWADQRKYSQFTADHADNPFDCASGCGPTAWAMLFGWADHQAAEGHPRWKNRSGIYRTNGSKNGDHKAVAPETFFDEPGVASMIFEIRDDVDTFCWGESGATAPWDMKQAQNYLNGRTSADVKAGWNSVGIHQDYLRKRVRDSIIKYDTPAIIGTGWLKHYPLAWRYKSRSRYHKACGLCQTKKQWQFRFYVNQGWGGSSDGWVAGSTWFAGEIRP